MAALAPNPQNPRKITPSKLEALRKSLEHFGDLSGIIFNEESGQLIGGHQRTEVAHVLGVSEAVIERTYDPPTPVGTTAEGYVVLNGERHAFRRVRWPAKTEMAANIAANKNAGDFDIPALADMMREIRDFDIDLDLTMFDVAEREHLFASGQFEPSQEEPARLDEKKMAICPACGHEY